MWADGTTSCSPLGSPGPTQLHTCTCAAPGRPGVCDQRLAGRGAPPADSMTLGSPSAVSGLASQMALLHVIKGHMPPGDPESSDLLVGEGDSLGPQDSKGQRACFLLSGRSKTCRQNWGKALTCKLSL